MARKKSTENLPVAQEQNLPVKRKSSNLANVEFLTLEQDDNKREFIGKALNNILSVSRAFEAPVQSDEELCERLDWFFANCAETRQLPTIEKMALAIGHTRENMFEIANGTKRGFSNETAAILQKAKNLIASLDAELAQEGKIQPVVYLFRAKNYYGMRDQQEMVLTPNNRLSEYQDQRAIEQKYASLPKD